MLQDKKIIIWSLCIIILAVAITTSSIALAVSNSDTGVKSPGPGLHIVPYILDNSSGERDNMATYNFSVWATEEEDLESVTLTINTTYANYTILYNHSFSDSAFHLDGGEGNAKNVTLSMTIKYNTSHGIYNMKIDGRGYYELLGMWVTATCLYHVNVTETVIPAPTVLHPNGGETIPGGSDYDIEWSLSGGNLTANPITINFSTDNGGSWTSIATNELNDGVYSWSVPNIGSSNCLVKVEAEDEHGNIGSDISNSTFTITYTSPPSPPVAVPEYNMIGLLAFIGILSVVLAFATPRRKK